MKSRTTLITLLACALLVSAPVSIVAQEPGGTSDDVGPGVVSTGLRGMGPSEWASEIARLNLSLKRGQEASVAERCAAGDLGDVFVALVDTDEMAQCTIRDDQYIVRPLLVDCGITHAVHRKLQGPLNDGRAHKQAEFTWCLYSRAQDWEALSYTLDGNRTVIDDSFFVVGPPFAAKGAWTFDPPGNVVIMPVGHLLIYEPLAVGSHTLQVDGIRRSDDPGEPGRPVQLSVEFEVVPAGAE